MIVLWKTFGHMLKTSKRIYFIMLFNFSHQRSIMPIVLWKTFGHLLKTSKGIYSIMWFNFSHQRSIMPTMMQIVHTRIVQICPYSSSTWTTTMVLCDSLYYITIDISVGSIVSQSTLPIRSFQWALEGQIWDPMWFPGFRKCLF